MEEDKSDYILAIDAGQSETSCLIGLKDGTLLSSGLSGPSAVPNLKLAEPMMRQALTSSVNKALDAISPRPKKVAAAYLSLTGGIPIALRILPEIIQVDRIKAESDAVAALACGAFGGPGIALLSGTGCVAFTQNTQGEGKVIGGWGYLLGDEGSGFWIGMEAVRAAIRAQDGRGSVTPFTREVIVQLGVKDMLEAQVLIYNDGITRPEIARLSFLVTKAAQANDPIAQDIITRACQELFKLLKAACHSAAFTQPEEKVIVLTGGVLHPDSPVFSELVEMIQRELPSYKVVVPKFPPVVGAFILGIILCGGKVMPETISRIEETLPRLPAHHLKV
jgi:glucosamine kinase